MFNVNSAASAAVESLHALAGGLPADAPASDLVDLVRVKAEELRALLQEVEAHIDDQHEHAKATDDVDEMQRLTDADPYRWHADAKHSLQSGVMFLERAVTQSTTF